MSLYQGKHHPCVSVGVQANRLSHTLVSSTHLLHCCVIWADGNELCQLVT